ncbi:hypothetical protein [Saccharopolyspora shandongensis]|uniref:hypothetical protein n=1 Tax=Saccharopolyspora shandongensis TaxID=418495 RepID=UPI0033EEFC86
MGVRALSSRVEPAFVEGDGGVGLRQRVDADTGLPVWLLEISDMALVTQPRCSFTVELLAKDKPHVSAGVIEFFGLTVEPIVGGTEAQPWTDFQHRALGVTAAPRNQEDTKPLPKALLLGVAEDIRAESATRPGERAS